MYLNMRRLMETVARYLALFGFAGLLFLCLLVVLDIILRALFQYPLQGVSDVSAVVMAAVISACIPQCLLGKQNISIDVLGAAIGKWAEHLFNAFASLAVLLFFMAMTWQFVPYAEGLTQSGQKTWVLKWPVGPWWWAVTVLLGFATIAQLFVLLDDIALLLGKTCPDEGVSTDQDNFSGEL